MDKSRLEQIENIYQEAIEQPADARRAFLDAACNNDSGLRREVESLLRYDDRDSNFLDSPPGLLAAEVFSGDGEQRDLLGRQVGRYKIEKLLGHGGMGEVYLASDPGLQRRVALKVLPHSIINDAERLLRFEREAQAASALNHPNILTVHEFGVDNGVHFIASEFVDGETLRQKLSEPMDLAEALEIAIQVSSALTAAHDAGITHRDIKPENIMVRRDGYVKVLDFGLAKLRQVEPPATGRASEEPTKPLLNTEPGVVMGTDAYMSPEQARGRPVDARTDIWSLGVVIYEMLTGKRPFTGETRADMIVSVLSSEPSSVSLHGPGLPAELDEIVAKTLSKDAEARYQTSKELRVDLIKIKRQLDLHESMGSSEVRDPRTDSPNKEKIHSTIETGLRTSKDAGPTDGQGSEPVSFPSSRFSSVLGKSSSRKAGLSILALAVLGIAAITYFAFLAPKATAQIDSIAVLPFENLSGNADLTYASDGLSEALIDRFSQLPQLKVISRSSSFKFRGGDIDVHDVSTKLGARAIVTGTVNKVGDDLAIRIDVVDAVENRQIAGANYRRKATDLITIPNEIAKATSDQLRLKLTGPQEKRLTENDTANAEAYSYYLSGLVELNGPDQTRGSALDHFETAIKLDPNFAAAYAEIGWVYLAQANATDDPGVLLPKAKEAIERALTIDPNLAKAHALRAMLYESEFDWKSAEREYRKAIELNPNLDFARNYYAFFLSNMGRQDESLAQLEEQRLRDPINRWLGILQKAIILVQGRKFDEALAQYQEAQAVEPTKKVPDLALGYAYAGKGMYNEAAEYYRKAVEVLGGEDKYSQGLVYLAATYAKIPEKREESRAILRRIEAMNGYKSPALMAVIYAELGENDMAIRQLEEAYIKRDLLLRYVGVAYEYDGLRNDPRFSDLTKRIGLSG